MKDKTLFGKYGGIYLPELLMAPIEELAMAWEHYSLDSAFLLELDGILKNYAGRPTPLTEVPRFAKEVGKGRVFLKREDLLHTGAHKINNSLGQCLLAKKMGKSRIIAETGAGQHGVATATACALFGLSCVVYMGSVDMERQAPNVTKMRLLGAEVREVEQGSATLKDAVNEALRDWSHHFETTHYCLGSALGPYPYPSMVEAFQAIIGKEARSQILSSLDRLPNQVIACVGGGSNAIGLFSGFFNDPEVQLIGVEAGGIGAGIGQHAARFQEGRPGILHGTFTYLLQNEEGQVAQTHSISAGLDYPAVGPHHAHLFEKGAAMYTSVRDEIALKAMKMLSQTEGIIPALESSHALGYLLEQKTKENEVVIVNLSGRGDKDLPQLIQQGAI